jgi:hypothetical protein
MEATRHSETPVYSKPTRRHVPEDGILHPVLGHLHHVDMASSADVSEQTTVSSDSPGNEEFHLFEM